MSGLLHSPKHPPILIIKGSGAIGREKTCWHIWMLRNFKFGKTDGIVSTSCCRFTVFKCSLWLRSKVRRPIRGLFCIQSMIAGIGVSNSLILSVFTTEIIMETYFLLINFKASTVPTKQTQKDRTRSRLIWLVLFVFLSIGWSMTTCTCRPEMTAHFSVTGTCDARFGVKEPNLVRNSSFTLERMSSQPVLNCSVGDCAFFRYVSHTPFAL